MKKIICIFSVSRIEFGKNQNEDVRKGKDPQI